MERKVGEIFEHNGEWYQCIESDSCGECLLRTTECGSGTKSDLADEVFGECSKIRRSDSKHAIFKKLEKVGEPFPFYGYIVQRYVGAKFPIVAPNEKRFINCNEINNTIDIEVKQDNQNTEDMEANEKTMPAPDGWEFDRLDDSGNIVLVMTDFERTAYRNEIDFLQKEVERYKEQNKQLIEIIFKLKG